MPETFSDTLKRIISHDSVFREMDERAIEPAVVEPLLRQLGWNELDFTEIYRQWPLPDGSKVDYALRVESKCKILIEVKRWRHELNDEDVEQLEKYCRLAKPKPNLAVLTSGKIWRLYLPPTGTRSETTSLRKFLELDITSASPGQVEDDFRFFLDRDRMVDFRPVGDEAERRHQAEEDFRTFERKIRNALTEASENKKALSNLISAIAEKENIPASRSNVTKLADSLSESLIIDISGPKKSHKKPHRFTLSTAPGGNLGHRRVENSTGWSYFLIELCQLMQKRHSNNFRQNILSLNKRFSETEDNKYKLQVGNLGIYAVWVSAAEFRETCYEVVGKFGYQRAELVIRDNNGEVL